jgi:hypothetical protein
VKIDLPQVPVGVGERELARIAQAARAAAQGCRKLPEFMISLAGVSNVEAEGGDHAEMLSVEEAEDLAYRQRLEAAVLLAQQEEERQREEEEQRRKEEAAEEQAQRQRMATQQQDRERRRQNQEKVSAFLRAHGFTNVQAKRKRMMRSCYPLHAAVMENSPEMIQLLVDAGADRGARNSSGQTPEVLAQRLDKSGTHEQVITALKLPPSSR